MTRPKAQAGLGRNGPVWNAVGTQVNDMIDDWTTWDAPPHIFRQVGSTRVSEQNSTQTVVGWFNDPRSVKRRFTDEDVRIEDGDSPLHVVYRASQTPILGMGDHTVPLSSATLGRDPRVGKKDVSGVQRPDGSDNPWIEEFEIYPCAHVDLVTAACTNDEGRSALDRTVEILRSGFEATAADDAIGKRATPFSKGSFIKQNIVYVSSTGRVEVHVTNPGGDHTGPATTDDNTNIEYGIAGLGYFPTEFGAVVVLPDQQAYTVTATSVEPSAESSIQITRMLTEEVGERASILFPEIHVPEGGSVRFVLQNGVTDTQHPLDVDADGNGGYEGSQTPAVISTGAGYAPAIPRPTPGIVEQSAALGSEDGIAAQIGFSDGGSADWEWGISWSEDWLSAASI